MRNLEREQNIVGELYLQPAIDTNGKRLGYAVSVLVNDGKQAEFIVLQHCDYSAEAKRVKQGILNFLDSHHPLIANVASSRELWEWIALVPGDSEMYWTMLDDKALTAFRSNQYQLCYNHSDWHPNLPSSFSKWVEQYC